MIRTSLSAVLSLIAVLASAQQASASPPDQTTEPAPNVEPLDAATLDGLKVLYKQLIDAENRHDLAAVRPFLWISPSTLFVAKTATAAEGNWAGLGTE
jgi:hypothetical protein